MKRRGFTLIEILVVIAVVGILSLVVLYFVNPAELMKQSRDSARILAMTTLNSTIATYKSDPKSGSMGQLNTIYISVPDPTATSTAGDQCQGLGLSPLPAGWTYQCASPSNYKKIDGTGWIPLNLQGLSFPPTISSWPVDPVDQTSTYNYFSYVTNGSQFQLAGLFESSKYEPQAFNGNQYDPLLYEAGDNVNIAPFVAGMVAYWPMNEGSGSTASDLSGYGNNGTIHNGTWSTSNCNTGQTGCLFFDGVGTYIQAGPDSILNNPALTMCSWIFLQSTSTVQQGNIIGNDGTSAAVNNGPGNLLFTWTNDQDHGVTSPALSLGYASWEHLCGTRDSNPITNLYVNAVRVANGNVGGIRTSLSPTIIGADWDGGVIDLFFPPGYISGVRVYNRVLSSAEIQSLYNARD